MAGEWFLNRPNGSIEGGIPGFLFWDGVVPWTTPVDPVGDPNWPNSNGWWPIVNGDFRPGIFQPFADQLGWQRNIVGDYGAYASFKRNFPAGDPSDTGFKIALVVCEGLQQSGVAPPRSLRDRPDQLTPEDDPTTGYWLYNWTDGEGKGALHRCWELYMRDFMELGDDYYVIVGLPEREIKQMFYAEDGGNGEAGYLAIWEFVQFILAQPWAHRVIGWFLCDEPDFDRKGDYLTPNNIKVVRALVRSAEEDFNRQQSPPLNQALRPAIINLSPRWFRDAPTDPLRRDREIRKFAACADLFTFGSYPSRLTADEVQADYVGHGVPQSVWDNTLAPQLADHGIVGPYEINVAHAVRDYLVGCKLFHNILNTERPGDLPTRFGQPGYRPIMYWIQAFGGVRLRTRNGVQQPPWRPQPEDLPPDWFWPAFLFAPRPTPATTDLDYERLRAIPTPDQLRTVSWASMILLSEGLPVFALHGIPSSLLLTSDTLPEESDGRYAAVAKEILYFARLRWNLAGNDRSDLLNAQWSSRPLAGSGWQQGATLFVHFPDGTTESEEWWLLLRNFGTEPVALAMQPALGTGTPGPGRVLVEYRFQQQVRDPITDEVIFFRHTQPVALRLEPISVRLFRLETPPPP